MSATSDRKVVIALFVIFVLVLIGAAVCIYRKEAADLQLLQARLETDQTRLADVKEKVNRMPQLEVEFGQLQNRLSFLERPLPDAAYIPTFLKQIEQLAVDTNNQIVSIRPKRKQKTMGAKKEGTKMNAETGELVKEEGPSKEEKPAASKKEDSLPYEFVPIEFKMEGSYWTTLEFLRKLQRFPKMIAVNTVAFAPRSNPNVEVGADTQALAVTFDLTAVVTKGAKDGQSQ